MRIVLRPEMTVDDIASQFRNSRIPPEKVRRIVAELNHIVKSSDCRPIRQEDWEI